MQIAAACEADLILLDIMMPGTDGYQTCRIVRQDPTRADIPVMFLTAKSHPEDEALGLQAGAVDYLSKPISPPFLYARVATLLSMASMAETRDENITLLYKSPPLHDIGKAGLAEAILLKPGKLDQAEIDFMQLHAVRGRDTICQVEEANGGSNGFLTYACEIAHSHSHARTRSGGAAPAIPNNWRAQRYRWQSG